MSTKKVDHEKMYFFQEERSIDNRSMIARGKGLKIRDGDPLFLVFEK
jgi:hypothetical protein